MAYFDRQAQLDKTLISMTNSKQKDFNVIIVDDCSPKDLIIPPLPFEVIILKLSNKSWFNSALVYNVGFLSALKRNPDIIIIQNPECYHVGDVLDYATKITDETYISFGCFSINEKTSSSEYDLNKVINENNYGVTWDGQNAWYNHPVHCPVGFHFCTAITTKNLIKTNGFDERFLFGRAYDDDYLIHQIKSLGLKIEITTDPFVVHQWHYNCQAAGDKGLLWERNRILYQELVKTKNYRAMHLSTPNLDGNK